MSNCAMSNETELDWLARNVHAWPENCIIEIATTEIPSKLAFDGVAFSLQQSAPISRHATYVTKQQWLARRAELQNRPSWEDAPKWAEWLAQDEDGEWKWLAGLPGKYVDGWTAVKIKGCCKGHALGDWRDTLEKRPEEFQPFTSIEDNQENVMAQQQEMKQDSGWFERGELPPVGVECDIRHSCWNSEKYEKVTVAAITNEYLIVKYATFEQHYMLKDISFRPIRTERDELISVIIEEMNRYDTDAKLADAILAAGFKLEAK